MAGAHLIFLTFSLFICTTHFASECLLIPRPEAEITKCLSRRGRQIRGYPDWLILGMGRKIKIGGLGFWAKKSPYMGR